jgi:hypothetical protein
MLFSTINPLIAFGVVVTTGLTDAAYVMFTSAVLARKRIPAATWSSILYLLSSFAIINYTHNWLYLLFAALGSWFGAFASMTFLRQPREHRLDRNPNRCLRLPGCYRLWIFLRGSSDANEFAASRIVEGRRASGSLCLTRALRAARAGHRSHLYRIRRAALARHVSPKSPIGHGAGACC